jgi:hypothetical protein
VIVSFIDVVVFVVLDIVPVVKFGTTGWDLTGMAYSKSSSKSFFINHRMVSSVTNCPVTVEPAPPSSKFSIP